MRSQPESSINAVIDRLEALGVQGVAPWIALGRSPRRAIERLARTPSPDRPCPQLFSEHAHFILDKGPGVEYIMSALIISRDARSGLT